MFWRKYTSIFARLRYLEQREDELTTALIEVRKELASTADLRAEIARILPPLRKALTTFDEFNKTY